MFQLLLEKSGFVTTMCKEKICLKNWYCVSVTHYVTIIISVYIKFIGLDTYLFLFMLFGIHIGKMHFMSVILHFIFIFYLNEMCFTYIQVVKIYMIFNSYGIFTNEYDWIKNNRVYCNYNLSNSVKRLHSMMLPL